MLLAALVLSVSAYAVFSDSEMFSAGKARREALEQLDHDPDIVAVFHGEEIDRAAVEYTRQMNFMRSEEEAKKYNTDRDVIDRIVENIVLLEEAEKRGLAATDEEIEDMISETELAYEMPEGKEMIDQYCQGMGVTFEEYLADLREMAPRTIARNKLKNSVIDAYLVEHGLDLIHRNPPHEAFEELEQFIRDLFEANKQDIQYFVD